MKEHYIGMVLSASTVGEYDKRVVLLTKEAGRISAFARGARRPKSVLSAVTEPFCFGEFYLYLGRDSATIEEVKATNFFPKLRNDLDRLTMGLYFCEVADYFTREGMGAVEELELLYRSLTALESAPAGSEKVVTDAGESSADAGLFVPIRLIRRIFELRMLVIAGYSPLYMEEKECWRDETGDWKLSRTAAYTVGQIISKPMKALFSFSVSDSVLGELETCIGNFFRRNTDREFRSLTALDVFS
ncbi:MAG: DNA repair protein RecO [Eubacterium sp.]|nr:DNA repair protein RecO [Eubacterium sp.]